MSVNLRGLTIEIKPTFLVFAGLMAALGMAPEFAALFLFAALHEAAHMAAGAASGLRVSRVSAAPFGLSAELPGFEELRLFQRLFILASGPALNLICAATARLISGDGFAVRLNLALALFNALPALPLDGGRIALAALSGRFGALNANRAAAAAGRLTCAALAAAGLVQAVLFPYNISLLIMSVYIFKRLRAESAAVVFDFYRDAVLENKKARTARLYPVRHYFAGPGVTAGACLNKISRDNYCVFVINGEYVGEERVAEAAGEKGLNAVIS